MASVRLLHPDPHHLPELKTLTQYEAVQLFIQRAGAVKADFTLTGANAPAVAEICARLDGLPLAIELAAARSNLLTPQGLVARLGRSPALLTGGSRDRPARQQTLRQTIDWSYSLLSDDERQCFTGWRSSSAGARWKLWRACASSPGATLSTTSAH